MLADKNELSAHHRDWTRIDLDGKQPAELNGVQVHKLMSTRTQLMSTHTHAVLMSTHLAAERAHELMSINTKTHTRSHALELMSTHCAAHLAVCPHAAVVEH